ncbi:precorrin-6A/cobalt-precorrin-6A reductase [Marinomonas sp. 15G1-11]|uniref:Precorrin-6A/cobalt-precorrin-6A reductase n=1 Tax=Marinomonas phaeophyticola TaxID=3004091 RepID=A0ABT4JXM9_9GAMM|nr:precorrin-6A/cobalt-precorrin-6A reductase [Marinomonas sp. 15G1-11]MCZ2723144.1 precorrin-6A/cobalt-precorrin-6A reductase [Marinomonas sp. 15G1-11]
MTILLLGGTADARYAADALHQAGLKIIYSIAGLVRVPKVDCALLVGGFSKRGGLSHYIEKNNIRAIVDITHPYAQNMSNKAVLAAKKQNIPYWRLDRAAWTPLTGDKWTEYASDIELSDILKNTNRPLLSAGQVDSERLWSWADQANIERIFWRTAVAPKFDIPANVTWLKAIGPFSYEQERSLIEQYNIDAIITKNSGGESTYAKLVVARDKGLPVFLHRRPILLPAEREFYDVESCVKACVDAFGTPNNFFEGARSQ